MAWEGSAVSVKTYLPSALWWAVLGLGTWCTAFQSDSAAWDESWDLEDWGFSLMWYHMLINEKQLPILHLCRSPCYLLKQALSSCSMVVPAVIACLEGATSTLWPVLLVSLWVTSLRAKTTLKSLFFQGCANMGSRDLRILQAVFSLVCGWLCCVIWSPWRTFGGLYLCTGV